MIHESSELQSIHESWRRFTSSRVVRTWYACVDVKVSLQLKQRALPDIRRRGSPVTTFLTIGAYRMSSKSSVRMPSPTTRVRYTKPDIDDLGDLNGEWRRGSFNV